MRLLKITGTLMIIGGALLTALFIAGIAGGAYYSAAGSMSGNAFIFLALIGGVMAVALLAAGILGVISRGDPAKVGICFIMGLVVIALCLINNISSMAVTGFNTSMVSNILVGLILPGLYTYAAFTLKNK